MRLFKGFAFRFKFIIRVYSNPSYQAIPAKKPYTNLLYRFKFFCFSASLTNFFPLTSSPFRTLTPSIYRFATFSRSANSPRSSSSSSVKGTQYGSSSSVSKPWNTSCGDAAPEVRLRISSLKPKDSATGSTDRMVKNGVPSFSDSEIMRPRRRVMTP